MGHIHFENIFKVNKKEVVRYIPEITKPSSTMWKYFQHGKQTRVEFKTKEHSTKKLLELVHTNLGETTRTKVLDGEE